MIAPPIDCALPPMRPFVCNLAKAWVSSGGPLARSPQICSSLVAAINGYRIAVGARLRLKIICMYVCMNVKARDYVVIDARYSRDGRRFAP